MGDVVEYEVLPDAVHITLICDHFDYRTTGKIQQFVLAAMAQVEKLPIILDMRRVVFINSLGMGALVAMMQALKDKKRHFAIIGVNAHITKALTESKLDTILDIHDSLDDAVCAILD